jgi:hypothetical protein
LAYLGQSCGFQKPGLNAPRQWNGVYEFPITVFRNSVSPGYKPLEISAVSNMEILATIRTLRDAGCRDVVLSLHSFSLLKNLGLRFENRRPDHIVIRRLRKLCGALARLRDEIEVAVLGEVPGRPIVLPQPDVIPSLGWVRPAMRKVVQGVNRLSWV